MHTIIVRYGGLSGPVQADDVASHNVSGGTLNQYPVSGVAGDEILGLRRGPSDEVIVRGGDEDAIQITLRGAAYPIHADEILGYDVAATAGELDPRCAGEVADPKPAYFATAAGDEEPRRCAADGCAVQNNQGQIAEERLRSAVNLYRVGYCRERRGRRYRLLARPDAERDQVFARRCIRLLDRRSQRAYARACVALSIAGTGVGAVACVVYDHGSARVYGHNPHPHTIGIDRQELAVRAQGHIPRLEPGQRDHAHFQKRGHIQYVNAGVVRPVAGVPGRVQGDAQRVAGPGYGAEEVRLRVEEVCVPRRVRCHEESVTCRVRRNAISVVVDEPHRRKAIGGSRVNRNRTRGIATESHADVASVSASH